MTISGNFHDATALTVFDRNLHNIMYQTNFRCEKFLQKKPFGEGNKGKLMRVNRTFSEGLPVALNDRFTPIESTRETRFDSRWVSTLDHVSVEYVDEKDIMESLMDPTGTLARSQVESFNRKLDIDSVSAMFAPVLIGGSEAAITPITWATDGGIIIDMTAGATYEKLLSIKENLIDREVINEGDVKIYMSIDGGMNTQLLSELEITSSLYNSSRNAETGEITSVVGIELIRFGSGSDVPDPILPVSGGVRTGFATSNKGMNFYVQREMDTVIEKDPTHHQTWRVITTMRYGFLRMDARHVMKVTTTA